MNYQVVISTPAWKLNGVNVHAANLIRGVRALNVDAHVLLTDPDRRGTLADMDLPGDIDFARLPVPAGADWPARWNCMIEYLENRKPCIFLPNYDWPYAAVSPRLSAGVGVVGIVHSDDPVRWYRKVAMLYPYWNACVAVSDAIAAELRSRFPDIGERLHVIHCGVNVPATLCERPVSSHQPLRLVYAGRVVQEQKRVFDFPMIMEALGERGVPAELSIIGSGPDAESLRQRSERLIASGHIRFLGVLDNAEVLKAFETSDVLLLTSAYEGLPVTLLEAMGRGCVPVVTDIRSGIPAVVKHGHNGFRLPVGDIPAFADRIAELYRDPELRLRLSRNAYAEMLNGGYRVEDMGRRFARLFEQVLEDAQSGAFQRPPGDIVLSAMDDAAGQPWKNRLTRVARSLARLAFGRVRRLAGGN